MLPHWLVRLKTRILRPALLMVHQQPQTRHRPQRQYKAKTQYRLVYAQVGYALHDAPSIDKAFKAINDVLTGDNIFLLNTVWADQDSPSPHSVVYGWLGAQGYQYRQYHCCGG